MTAGVDQDRTDASERWVLRLGLPDRFIDHGEQGQLLAELGLNKDGIVRAVRARADTQ